MRQFLRKVRLTASGSGSLVINPGGIQTHELKISFDVSKSISSSQNSAKIQIWNLSEGHRNAIGKELDDIVLEAGYMPPGEGGNVGIIFKGQMRDVEHKRDGPDIITTLSCGEGDRAFRKATISKTFRAGTEVKEVVDEIYKQLEAEGVDRGEWKFPDDISERKFKRPYSMCGGCKREMDTLGRGKGFYWSVQNGTMEIIPHDGYIGGIVLISPETGMVDTPTITDNGVKVSALLNPEIRPNRRVQIKSETLEMNAEGGEYRVSQCDYSGDNRDGDFVVQVHGEAIKGGKVDEGKKK
ncbi:hypothetical protein HQ945_08325 [Phyllobacterium sp. BT25]|uniref:Uncharacterized protein n=1 Tax=Phyllobacterium pellucidum TaxID=2740464 RepID=A0A849VRF8_9HYPH|nr:hypothetical protein [Phyllobacterium pellucidum]NTS31259.1 hypothetical protein [Phyllobacterium pellucidum]